MAGGGGGPAASAVIDVTPEEDKKPSGEGAGTVGRQTSTGLLVVATYRGGEGGNVESGTLRSACSAQAALHCAARCFHRTAACQSRRSSKPHWRGGNTGLPQRLRRRCPELAAASRPLAWSRRLRGAAPAAGTPGTLPGAAPCPGGFRAVPTLPSPSLQPRSSVARRPPCPTPLPARSPPLNPPHAAGRAPHPHPHPARLTSLAPPPSPPRPLPPPSRQGAQRAPQPQGWRIWGEVQGDQGSRGRGQGSSAGEALLRACFPVLCASTHALGGCSGAAARACVGAWQWGGVAGREGGDRAGKPRCARPGLRCRAVGTHHPASAAASAQAGAAGGAPAAAAPTPAAPDRGAKFRALKEKEAAAKAAAAAAPQVPHAATPRQLLLGGAVVTVLAGAVHAPAHACVAYGPAPACTVATGTTASPSARKPVAPTSGLCPPHATPTCTAGRQQQRRGGGGGAARRWRRCGGGGRGGLRVRF